MSDKTLEKKYKEYAKAYGYEDVDALKKALEDAGNLDITVPIGYNTVIVKNIKTVHKQPCYDKFEQAFYENE